MKKIIFPLLVASCLSLIATAQPRVEKSAPIDEPDDVGYDKVLLLKNGKTCYAHYSGDGALDVKIYTPDRKLANNTHITSQRWNAGKSKATTILGTYDINNELVIFLQQPDGRHPVLYRLRINTDDGKLLKEDVLATTKKGNSFFFRDFVQSQMHVVKDGRSGCYAVIFNDNLDENEDDAIKVMHFDEKHNLLSTARITSPDQKIRHVGYLDAAVCGNKSVFVSTYYTGNNDEESKIYLSKLNAGETSLTTKALDFTEDFHKTTAQIVYNYTMDKLQMLMVTYAKTKKQKDIYYSYLCNINPSTLDVAGVNELPNERISAFGRTNLALEDDFSGVPQAMMLNSKDEPVILKQSLALIYHTTSKGATYVAGMSFGNIGISELGLDGTEKQAYLLQHASATSNVLGVMYNKDIMNGKWDNPSATRMKSTSAQYYSYRYVFGKKNNYAIFRAPAKQIENPENEKWHRKKDNKSYKQNTGYTTMRNGNVSRAFLFGKPVGKKDNNMCFMDAADQTDDGTFATILISKKGKEKTACIAWVTFE